MRSFALSQGGVTFDNYCGAAASQPNRRGSTAFWRIFLEQPVIRLSSSLPRRPEPAQRRSGTPAVHGAPCRTGAGLPRAMKKATRVGHAGGLEVFRLSSQRRVSVADRGTPGDHQAKRAGEQGADEGRGGFGNGGECAIKLHWGRR